MSKFYIIGFAFAALLIASAVFADISQNFPINNASSDELEDLDFDYYGEVQGFKVWTVTNSTPSGFFSNMYAFSGEVPSKSITCGIFIMDYARSFNDSLRVELCNCNHRNFTLSLSKDLLSVQDAYCNYIGYRFEKL